MSGHIVLFASGSGSNAARIMDHFRDSSLARVVLVVSNNPKAGVIGRARERGVGVRMISSHDLDRPEELIGLLKEAGTDWIVLAGFLRRLPPGLVRAFPQRIINIHPSLLPAYGGRGMYGHHVHEAVHRDRATLTGITIHYVNEAYDEGEIIFQASTPLEPGVAPEEIEARVRELEARYFAPVIEELVRREAHNAHPKDPD